ncbi:Putative GATA-type sexual development transcription factor NsdD [Rhizopus microsporus]|nr:Putative GATA-type sexual development transcription factor NsdD [Rhizopus microsporus]
MMFRERDGIADKRYGNDKDNNNSLPSINTLLSMNNVSLSASAQPKYHNATPSTHTTQYEPIPTHANQSPFSVLHQPQNLLNEPTSMLPIFVKDKQHTSPIEMILTPSSFSTQTAEHDVNEIIYHCSIIGKLIREKSSAELNNIYTIKPWLDEMIDKANQLLNALLRLRKQQMAAEQMLNAHQTSANLDERYAMPLRKRKRRRLSFQGQCHSCNTSETPEWRRGPNGARTLCNACGLHYAKLSKKNKHSDDTSMK